jgi:uncharacterized protein YecE (DUF72 family)
MEFNSTNSHDPATMNAFPRGQLTEQIATLAARGVYVGTSSWKYEGWLGQIYSPERYMTRGKLSRSKLEKTCLAEYAEVFKTVCFDGGFYQFPSAAALDGIFSQVPGDFRLSIKVTEEITAQRFRNLSRYGKRAGSYNEHFLDAELFATAFLGPLAPYRERMGALIFEFGHFHPGDIERGRDFVTALGEFLGRLPSGWNYAVEVRNESFLQPAYFDALRARNVAHTINSWTRMPPALHQAQMPGSDTASFATARFLLKPGRAYEEAVQAFQPYMEIKEPYREGRDAIVYLLRQSTNNTSRRYYLYVNNRFEGSAPWTIVNALKALTDEAVAAR